MKRVRRRLRVTVGSRGDVDVYAEADVTFGGDGRPQVHGSPALSYAAPEGHPDLSDEEVGALFTPREIRARLRQEADNIARMSP